MYSFKISNLNRINNYLEIFKENFKGHIFSKKYLNWLYKKNLEKKIIGIDILHKNKIIGHCGGIPVKFVYKKKIISSVICINICLSSSHRKKGLIDNAQKKLLNLSKKKRYDFIFTVANETAKRSWLRSINANYLKPLEVKFFFNFKLKDNISNLFKNVMTPRWSEKKIKWRIQSPRSKFEVKNISSLECLVNNISIFKSISPLRISKNIKYDYFKYRSLIPNIFIGIGFKRVFNNFFSLEIPLFLRPSPLYFIYKIINKSKLKEKNFKDIQFSLADFDVY